MSAYELYSLIVTVAVMLGVVVFILLFERKRAREIERNLRPDEPGNTRDNPAGRVTPKHDRGTEH